MREGTWEKMITSPGYRELAIRLPWKCCAKTSGSGLACFYFRIFLFFGHKTSECNMGWTSRLSSLGERPCNQIPCHPLPWVTGRQNVNKLQGRDDCIMNSNIFARGRERVVFELNFGMWMGRSDSIALSPSWMDNCQNSQWSGYHSICLSTFRFAHATGSGIQFRLDESSQCPIYTNGCDIQSNIWWNPSRYRWIDKNRHLLSIGIQAGQNE